MKDKIIKSEAGYEAAMARLSTLMDIDAAPGSGEEAEWELLALVIEDYEHGIAGNRPTVIRRLHQPIIFAPTPPPNAAVRPRAIFLDC